MSAPRIIDQAVLDDVSAAAKASPRLRKNRNCQPMATLIYAREYLERLVSMLR